MRHRISAVVPALTTAFLLLSSAAAAQFGARPPDRSSLLDDGALHVVICGSGSPLPSVERAGPCTAVIAGALSEHLGDREIARPGHFDGLLGDGRNLILDRGLRLGFEEGLYLRVDWHSARSVGS